MRPGRLATTRAGRPGRLATVAGWLCLLSMLALSGPGVKVERSAASADRAAAAEASDAPTDR